MKGDTDTYKRRYGCVREDTDTHVRGHRYL